MPPPFLDYNTKEGKIKELIVNFEWTFRFCLKREINPSGHIFPTSLFLSYLN